MVFLRRFDEIPKRTWQHSLLGTLRIFYTTLILMLSARHVNGQIGYFWHITDLHLDSFYSTKGDVLKNCWHVEHHQSGSSGRSPGRFGDHLCDSPWKLLESASLAMKSRQGDNVEFVLWTGDGLSHSAHRLLESHRLDILRNITELLGRTFPSQFVFPVLGHEDGSNNNFRRLGELWRHWLPSEALQTFEKGGYYTIEQTKSRLRIIALNTNFMRHDPKYTQGPLAAVRQKQSSNFMSGNKKIVDSPEYKGYYLHNSGGHYFHGDSLNTYGYGSIQNNGNGVKVSALSGYENHETERQWDWLEDVLAKSSRNKETVYIVGHIPPGSDERLIGNQVNGHTTFSEKNNLRYLRLVQKYSSIIQGQFFGHLHSDSFRIIYNDMGKPVSWIMISPSVTPRKANIGSNNPAMRLYKFDTNSGQVLDYTQYYLDLTAANTMGEANWQPEYNLTTHYYGLGEVSAVSLHNLADRFTNVENPLFAKYYRANSVRYPSQRCEGICSLYHYCAITRVDYPEFRLCLETATGALASKSSSNSCSLYFLKALLFLYALDKLKEGVVLFNAICYLGIFIYYIMRKLSTNLLLKVFICTKFKLKSSRVIARNSTSINYFIKNDTSWSFSLKKACTNIVFEYLCRIYGQTKDVARIISFKLLWIFRETWKIMWKLQLNYRSCI